MQIALTKIGGARRWDVQAEAAKWRHVGHLPARGEQGVDLALPNACVFRVVDDSYDEGRIGISGPAFSRGVTQRQRGHHKSWTWPAGRATPRVSKKRRETEAIASTS